MHANAIGAPSAVELAAAVTEQLREYLRDRRRDAAYIGTDYAVLTEALEELVARTPDDLNAPLRPYPAAAWPDGAVSR